LPYLRDCRTTSPSAASCGRLLRPRDKIVDDLLRELAAAAHPHGHRRGRIWRQAGLVTIEDLLEEIVGEIQDEYDAEEPLLQDLGGGEYLCDAG